jgi:excisionase family DNA binding protein
MNMDSTGQSGQEKEPAFYTLKQAAMLLGVSERTLRRLLEAGKFRGYKLGRQWRIPKSMIDRMRADNEANPPEPEPPDTPLMEGG